MVPCGVISGPERQHGATGKFLLVGDEASGFRAGVTAALSRMLERIIFRLPSRQTVSSVWDVTPSTHGAGRLDVAQGER